METHHMHDAEEGGMGFYTVIESRLLGDSFFILESNPDNVTIVGDILFDEGFATRQSLAKELRALADALDEPLLG